MKDTLLLRFLYKTVVGRMLLQIFVQPKISKIGGAVLSSHVSRAAIPYYKKKHQIDMTDIIIPEGGFSSFNDFFTRKRNVEMLDITKGHLISPSDGLLTAVSITKETSFCIKHTQYFLKDLLEDPNLAELFEGGMALVIRLTPSHYHRYCYAADGSMCSTKTIAGVLHCVRPVALAETPVFVQNSRTYQVIDTSYFGTMVQMEIGALLVGKITNHPISLQEPDVQAGEEKGYFEFGGSTIVLLFQKGQIQINSKLYELQDENGEIPVRMGECIASNMIRKS